MGALYASLMIYNVSLRVLKAFCFLAASQHELKTYTRHVPELYREFDKALNSIEIGMFNLWNSSFHEHIYNPIEYSARSPAQCIKTLHKVKL